MKAKKNSIRLVTKGDATITPISREKALEVHKKKWGAVYFVTPEGVWHRIFEEEGEGGDWDTRPVQEPQDGVQVVTLNESQQGKGKQ